jgi:putative phosphonate metabolism protein
VTARYAVYFAPEHDSPWRKLGAHWLGRDEYDNRTLIQPALGFITPQDLETFTSEPRRYGFHATLKAPFRLQSGYDKAKLVQRLASLATKLRPVQMGPMAVSHLGAFIAMTPEVASNGLMALAETCVTELDELRAPLLQADLDRRRIDLLDERGRELLAQYGYPYVLERFQFHMTLTGPISEAWATQICQHLAPEINQLNTASPLVLDRICLFVQCTPDSAFIRLTDALLTP